MSDTPTPDLEADDQEQPDQPDPDLEDGRDPRLTKARKEAASYRTRLRDVEARLEAATGQLTRLRRAAIEQAATGPGRLRDGADLWAAGITVDELVDDDGNVDRDLLDQAVTKVRTDRPHWAAPQPTPQRPREKLTPGASPADDGRPTTWADVLKAPTPGPGS